MNRILRSTPYLLLASCLAAPLAGAEAASGARAVVDEPTHDLGVVAVGADANHEFVVRNEGAAPLELRNPRAMRPGLIVSHDASIAPGASGRVRVRADTWAFTGPAELPFAIENNVAGGAPLRLDLKLDVRAFLHLEPGKGRFNVVQGEPEGTLGFTLTADDGAGFQILEARSPFPYLRVSTRVARSDERVDLGSANQYRVEATLGSEPPIGVLDGFVTLRVDHPRQRELRLPIVGFVRPALAVTPPRAALGDVRRGHRAALLVKSFASVPVTLTSATTDVPGLALEVKVVEPGVSFNLVVSVRPDAPPGARHGSLRIATSHPTHPSLEVPVSLRVVE